MEYNWKNDFKKQIWAEEENQWKGNQISAPKENASSEKVKQNGFHNNPSGKLDLDIILEKSVF